MKVLLGVVLSVLLTMLPLTASADTYDVYTDSEAKTFTLGETSIPYRLVLPREYDETKSYPLIFFFHGAGERGNDNELQLFHCVQYIADNVPDAIIVAPQCPVGNQWVDTPWSDGAYSVDNIPESNELATVMKLFEQLKADYSVDTDRVYATGISMGGFAVWDLLMRHNDVFAAGIPVCGGGDISKGELLKDTPIFTFHGTVDSSVPFSGTKDTVEAIRTSGGTKIEFTVYEGQDHGIWNTAFATEGLFEKLLSCKLSDRYPTEVSEEASVEVSEAVSDTSSGNGDKAPLLNYLLYGLSIVAVLAIAVFLVLKFKK